MSVDVDGALERLQAGLGDEQTAAVLAAAGALRERLETLLADRRLEPDDALLAERRHLHQHLTVLEDKARAGRFEAAQEDLEEIDEQARRLAEAIRARPAEEAQPPGGLAIRRVGLVARREARARWPEALGLAALVAVALGLALQAAADRALAGAWAAALEPLLAASALGGLAVGAGALGEDRRAGRLHLLVGHGLSRVGVLAAKFAGVAALLAAAMAGPFLGVALLAALTGTVVTIGGLLAPLAGLWLAAASFAALALALEAAGASSRASLVAGLGAYLLAGPVWRAAFLAGEPAASLAVDLVFRASPLAATRHLLAAETAGSAGLASLVPAAWTLGLLGAALVSARGGLALPASERN